MKKRFAGEVFTRARSTVGAREVAATMYYLPYRSLPTVTWYTRMGTYER